MGVHDRITPDLANFRHRVHYYIWWWRLSKLTTLARSKEPASGKSPSSHKRNPGSVSLIRKIQPRRAGRHNPAAAGTADITRRQRANLLPGPKPKPTQAHPGPGRLVSHNHAAGAPSTRGGQLRHHQCVLAGGILQHLVAASPPSTASSPQKPRKISARVDHQ
jgi:hypothetical protein